jgi:hypothetical protein
MSVWTQEPSLPIMQSIPVGCPQLGPTTRRARGLQLRSRPPVGQREARGFDQRRPCTRNEKRSGDLNPRGSSLMGSASTDRSNHRAHHRPNGGEMKIRQNVVPKSVQNERHAPAGGAARSSFWRPSPARCSTCGAYSELGIHATRQRVGWRMPARPLTEIHEVLGHAAMQTTLG